MRLKATLSAAALAGWFFLPSPAAAITAEDVLDKMSSDESTGYIYGSMETAAFLSHLQGKSERSECITDWYHDKGGVKQIIDTLHRFKDRQAQPIIYALIKRACGE